MPVVKSKRKKAIKSIKKEKKPRVSPKSDETELELPVYDMEGKEVSSVKLEKEIFGLKKNQDLIHQVVVSQAANRRRVIAHTKDRSEVRGGGKKPWRQKGTGRARHGSIRSPLWKGGGVTFGPTKARVFKKEIPKKMRRLAFFMVISAKAQNSLLILLDKLKVDELRSSSATESRLRDEGGKESEALFDFANARVIEKSPKENLQFPTGQAKTKLTKTMAEILKKLPCKDGTTLIALPEMDKNLILATRNLPYVQTVQAKDLNCLDLLSFKYLLMPKETIKVIKETFKK